MKDYIEYLNMPVKVVAVIAAFFLCMQIIGELLELKGKVVPEVMKIRKYFARKKQEREAFAKAIAAIEKFEKILAEFNLHYSTDNIKLRDGWMQGVNKSLEETDKHFQMLDKKLDKNNRDTLSLLIDSKRNTIISFASRVINENSPVTREEYNRIFKLYQEYEEIIEANEMTNGEVDIAYRIIKESYEKHMRSHTFIEDIRGYDPKK